MPKFEGKLRREWSRPKEPAKEGFAGGGAAEEETVARRMGNGNDKEFKS